MKPAGKKTAAEEGTSKENPKKGKKTAVDDGTSAAQKTVTKEGNASKEKPKKGRGRNMLPKTPRSAQKRKSTSSSGRGRKKHKVFEIEKQSFL